MPRNGAAALRSLEFHVQTDLYLTPTASFADIVLPIASAWEREGLSVGFRLDQSANERVQFRPAIVAPRGEARSDIDLVFDLAVRLGLGEHFWHGDVAAALDHYLAPSGITLEQLRSAPHGIRFPLETGHLKYRRAGFATPSGKLEVFSDALQAIGQPPLPVFRAPEAERRFPLALSSAKTPLYCHSQHRNLPRLRRRCRSDRRDEPGDRRGAWDRRWRLGRDHDAEGPRPCARPAGPQPCRRRGGRAARLVAGMWRPWPAGLRSASADGANINLVIGAETFDPVSGAVPHRSYRCEISKFYD